MKYDIFIIGLGRIGSGIGSYSRNWNNHLKSILGRKWINQIFVDDKNKDLKSQVIESDYRILDINSYEINNKNNLILIDATNQEERLKRVKELSIKYNFKLIFCEKPTVQDMCVDYNIYPWNIIKLNYSRSSFKSTKIIRKLINKKKIKLEFSFNNGTLNTVPHFLNYVDCLGVKYEKDKVKIKNKNLISIDNIDIKFVKSKYDLFEIKFNIDDTILEYKSFGRFIKYKNKLWKLSEIDRRFRHIYDKFNSLNKMPSLKSDKENYNLVKLIKEHIGEGY